MKNIFRISRLLILLLFGLMACTKESSNLNDLNDTLMVRHKKADMPAYIHGNGSEKVFLIILHGGPGGTGLQYRNSTIKEEIEKNNAVVYFDQRGSGSAQGSYSESDVSVDLMAEDVLALVKVLQTKYGNDSKFFLLGHSWGGTLGPAVLLKNQDVFSGWIDLDGDHDPKGSYTKNKVALEKMALEQIDQNNSISFWQDVITLVNGVSPNYNSDDLFKMNRKSHELEKTLMDDKVINKSQAGDYTPPLNVLTALWNNNKILNIFINNGFYENVSFTSELEKIKIPSLVLWGKYDVIVPFVDAQEAYDHLGSTEKELFIFEKSAHSPNDTEPELFAEKVIEFINQYK
ncbi:MAG: alpha/beta fold hydrolase [Flavobacteriales bacterium]